MEDLISSNTKKEDSISISKSSFKKIIGIVIGIAILSAFLGGYFVGVSSVEPEKIFIRDVDDVLGPIENKQEFGSEKIFISLDDDPVLGNPDAELTIVEFSDYQCPFCARFHIQTFPLIIENYIKTGKVNFVYRDFPIISIHPNALPAALASECADDQGKFWQFNDLLFTNQEVWKNLDEQSVALRFQEYAQLLELDVSEFESCLTDTIHLQEINKDLQDGRNYKITGTPGFFVGNEKIGYVKIDGAKPYADFVQIINLQLTKN